MHLVHTSKNTSQTAIRPNGLTYKGSFKALARPNNTRQQRRRLGLSLLMLGLSSALHAAEPTNTSLPTASADTGARVKTNAPIITTAADQSQLAITIYNDNLALVKDQRKMTIPSGEQTLEYRDISGMIQPETALLRHTQDPNAIKVLEQNFDFDLLSPEKLLEKYLGKTVQLARVHPASGAEIVEDAKVLSTHNGVIVQIGNRIETNPTQSASNSRFIFPEVPANLRATPTLTTVVNNHQVADPNSHNQEYELSYLTQGLSWKADYVAELTSDTRLDLASWVTLNNQSQTRYAQATVQLVAGDINRVRAPEPNIMMGHKMMRSESVADSSEDLLEYKLYSLPRKTTLENAQTKQVALFTANDVKVERELVFTTNNGYFNQRFGGEQKLKANIVLHWQNDKASNLGVPLPKGIVRVYQKDAQGNAQFVGEDRLDHTAENDEVRLTLGQSFDITAKRTQTSFSKVGNSSFRSDYQVVFNNPKTTAQQVKFKEHLWGDWSITQSSEAFEKANSHNAVWSLTLPANSQYTLTYSVLIES